MGKPRIIARGNTLKALVGQVATGAGGRLMIRLKEDDKLVYVVRLRQIASRAEARALAEELKGRFGITEPRVSG